jgi:hypothetical protein
LNESHPFHTSGMRLPNARSDRTPIARAYSPKITRQCAASSKPNQKGSGDAGGAWKRGRVSEDDDGEAEEEDDNGNEQGADDEMGELATLWLLEASAAV